jgi:hypothetical protein
MEDIRMDVELAKKMFINNWWKKHNTKNPETFDVNIVEIVEVHENGVSLVATIVKKGTVPQESDCRLYQVLKDGRCSTIIEGSI